MLWRGERRDRGFRKCSVFLNSPVFFHLTSISPVSSKACCKGALLRESSTVSLVCVLSLDRYLQRVVSHPSLLQDPDVREFLEREEVSGNCSESLRPGCLFKNKHLFSFVPWLLPLCLTELFINTSVMHVVVVASRNLL